MPVEPISSASHVQGVERPIPASSPAFLPAPNAQGLPSLEALGQLLLCLETQDRVQLEVQSQRIAAARGHLADLQRELMDDLAEALRGAQRAHKKKKGWFSKTLGDAVDLVAKVVGKGAEITKDLYVLQVDMAVSLVRNVNDPAELRASLRRDLMQLTESSETERAITGFVSGTSKFAGDYLAFQVSVSYALAQAAVRGDAAADVVRDQAARLCTSFQDNILHNPDFWVVVERAAQAAAITGVVASGGTLAPLAAVALMLMIEAEKRYGYLDDVVGKKAAPWVLIGMQAGLAATTAAAGASGNALGYIRGTTAVLEGVHAVDQGIQAEREGRRTAAVLEAQADMQATMHRMEQIRGLINRLVEEYEASSEERDAHLEAATALARSHQASHAAAVLPG